MSFINTDVSIKIADMYFPSLCVLHPGEIAAHVENRGLVPEQLCILTSRLESLIFHMRTFSDEILKARILYTVEADLEHWSGIPLGDVLAVFDQQVHSNGGNE